MTDKITFAQPPALNLTCYPFPLRAFVGGSFVDSSGNEKITLYSSVNDDIITNDLQWSNVDDVDAAVAAAEEGLARWQAMTNGERHGALVKYGQLLKQHREQLHWLEAVLTGKDHGFFNFEIEMAAELLAFYGAMIDNFPSEVLKSSDSSLTYTLRQPYGLTAGIIPFNAPLISFAMKVAPALAAGNAIIIKTSELNPFSTLFAAALSVDAGIPAGALNVLTGGSEAGNALASHPKIRKISFTGSVGVGRLVQIAAAKSNLKSVTLELGGKSPIIVFPDANLDQAVQAACMFLTLNGQGCALNTRLYVHEDVAGHVISKLKCVVEGHERTLGGDPLTPHTTSSPLYNHQQRTTVLSFIESGKIQAELLCGGGAVGEKGCYVKPTIFVNPQPDARILKEEIFGPVLTVVVFKTEEEVLALANETEFGLAAALWTKDIGRALRFARQLQAGSVRINGAGGFSPAVPTGGWKQSGHGLENGREAMLDWTQSKTVEFGM